METSFVHGPVSVTQVAHNKEKVSVGTLVQQCDQNAHTGRFKLVFEGRQCESHSGWVVNVRVSPSVFQLTIEINWWRLSIQWHKEQWIAKGHQRPRCSVSSRRGGEGFLGKLLGNLRGMLRSQGRTLRLKRPLRLCFLPSDPLKDGVGGAAAPSSSARRCLCHRRRREPFALTPATTQLAHAGPFRCAWAPTLEDD